eukprot:CAMPEP_0195532646 /NCGR_PEP_ID=MMETSP0794_2-20130614/38748_1 /TAXON_ID=515487 /ORGANISM="Stephanopyxis turris, Strain CCMP 815" /LENGTH=474 /DNA_ID=CAMNT_0040664953 /DNA_START=101 /DNA_END=1522 /DNA_ORIENTATION=-
MAFVPLLRAQSATHSRQIRPTKVTAARRYPGPHEVDPHEVHPVAHHAIAAHIAGPVRAASVPSISRAGLAHSFHLVLAFILGGIFFSTALSVITAFAALGRENIYRGWDLAKTVLARVWNIFTYGLSSARETLVEGKQWRFRDAWQVLKEQLTLTRKAASEGLEAIKLEASLYSAVVGQPALIALQYFVDNLTPKLLANMVKQNLINALAEMKNPNVRRIQLESFDFGNKGPTLVSARTYDLKDDSAMAMDIDMEWRSEMAARIKVTPKLLGMNRRNDRLTVPVKIANFRFAGIVRFVLTPLTDEPPGFGAALISFPKAPTIGFDCTLSAVEITKTPWLRTELLKEIQKAVANELLWPKRIIVPSGVSSVNAKSMLSRIELEKLSTSDPLLEAQRKVDSSELIKKNKITRETADEKALVKNMQVFVSDEAEGRVLLQMEEENDVLKNEEEKGDGGGGWRLPWQQKRGQAQEGSA